MKRKLPSLILQSPKYWNRASRSDLSMQSSDTVSQLVLCVFVLVALLCFFNTKAVALELDADFAPRFQNDFGMVNSVVELPDGSRLVGGSFDYLDEVYSPNLARILPDGSVDPNFTLHPDNDVNCILSDGTGGYFLGGYFTIIGGSYQPYLVKLDSNLELDANFNANLGSGPSSAVFELLLDGAGNLLVGGIFTTIDGHASRGAARILADGKVDTGFVSAFTNYSEVHDFALGVDGDIYAVGYLLDVGGQGFDHIALLNADGSLDAGFNPGVGASSRINAIEILPDGDLLIAGVFTSFDNVSALRLARLNPNGSPNPSIIGFPYSEVHTIKSLGDGRFLIGGDFTSYYNGSSTQSIRGIALLDSNLSLAGEQPNIDWDSSSRVFRLELNSNGEVLVYGTAEIAGALPARGIFTYDPITDTVTEGWQVWSTGVVHALWVDDDGSVLAGGEFSHVNGVEAPALARLTPSGELDGSFASGLTSFNDVFTLESHQGGLLVGGYFSSIGGESHRGLARIDPETGVLDTSFAMTQDVIYPSVQCVEVLPDDRIFVGGDNLAGPDYNNASNLVLLDSDGTRLLDWSEADGPNARVNAIERTADGSIWVGGSFSQWAGESKRLERLDPSFNYDPAFQPGKGPNSTVRALHALPDGRLLVGGFFSSYNGASTYRRLVRIDGDGSVDTSFANLSLSGSVSTIVEDAQGRILVGGNFSSGGGFILPRMARLSADGLIDSSVFEGKSADNSINSIALVGEHVHVGGRFETIDGEVRAAFASFAIPDGAPVITAHPEEVAVATGDDAFFSVMANGDAPLSYQWFKDGVQITGATGTLLSLAAVDPDDAAVYQVEVSNAAGTNLSAGAKLLVDPWPVITQHPRGGDFSWGDSVELSVAAVGAAPITYQWYRGNSGITTNPVNGETASTYSFTYSGPAKYWVRVSNFYGEVDSQAADLYDYIAPDPASITKDLVDQAVNVGDTATFTVEAEGDSPLSYAWTRDGLALNETGSTLTIFNIDVAAAGTYRVVVSNGSGSDNSQAELTVRTVPEFLVHPISVNANQGASVTLSASVAGPTPLTFQWEKNGTAIPGATNPSLQLISVGSSDVGDYQLLATNSHGTTASEVATVAVNSPPTISSGPNSAYLPSGNSRMLSVAASGSGPLSYAWFRGVSGDTSQPAGSSTSSLDTGSLSETTSFWVRVSNAYGSADSGTAVVTVGDAPSFTTQPVSQSLSAGQTATFSVSVVGDGTIQYQWFKNGFMFGGRTSSSLVLSSIDADDAGTYFLQASSEYGWTNSATATLTVLLPPSIDSQPESVSVVENESAFFQVTASGTGPLTYQWLRNGSSLVGATNASLLIESVTIDDVGDYQVRVSNDEGQVLSNTATLTINRPPAFTQQPAIQSFVANGSTVSLNVLAVGSEPLSYQWYEGNSGDTSTPVPGSTSATFESGALTASTSFWVRIVNPYGSEDSATSSVTVGHAPAIVTPPMSQEVTVGDTIELSVSVSGDGPFDYAWKKGGLAVAGATGSQLVITEAGLTDSGDYTVEVENLFGVVVSDPAVVSVTAEMPPAIIDDPESATLAVGEFVTLNVAASGSEPFNYQWFRDELSLNAETADSLTLGPLSTADAGEYWCRVSNGVGSADSNRATLVVLHAPLITTQPSTTTIATGSAVTIDVSASGDAPLAYQWYSGASGDTSLPVGTNSSSYQTPALQTSAQYWVRVSNAVGEADSVTGSISVIDPVEIVTQPQSQTVADSDLIEFSVVAEGGGTLGYEWRFNGETIEGADSAEYAFTAQFNKSGAYRVRVFNGISSTLSRTAELTVETPPFLLQSPANTTLAAGEALTLSVQADGSPTLEYQWQHDGVVLDGETGSTLMINAVGVANAGTYTVTVSNPFGSVEADAEVVVEGAPDLSVIFAPTEVEYGSNAQLSVQVVGPGSFQYFWYAGEAGDTTNLLATDVSSYTTGAMTANSSFWVRVTNEFGATDSETRSINVFQEEPVITSATIVSGSVGGLFTYRILATKGPSVFAASPLPAGLTINASTGLLSGVPESMGVYEVQLSASNETQTGTEMLNLTVHPPRPIHTGFDTVRGSAGESLSLALNLVNTVTEIDFPNLPGWLSYDSAMQTLGGIAPSPGEYTFQMVLTNAGGTTVQDLVFIAEPAEGAPVLVSPDFAVGRQGESFSFNFEAEPTAIEFELTGTLPNGLSWDPFTGILSGLPTESGAFEFSVRASDALDFGPSHTFVLEIVEGAGLPAITNLVEQRGYTQEAFELTLEATNAPTSFEATDLPLGISLVEDGGTGEWKLTGQPNFIGANVSRVRAVNTLGPGEWKKIEIDIRAGRVMPVISSGAVAEGRATVPFSFQLEATESPTAFYADGLPDGLTLDSATGLITGTPTAPGGYPVSVKAGNIDGTGPTLGMRFEIDVEPGAPVIRTEPVFVGRQSSDFSARIASTEDPVRFIALSDLPRGISLNEETGQLAGRPAAKGTYTFTVEAESAFGFVSEATELTMLVRGPFGTPNVTSALEIEAQLDEALNYSLTSDVAYTDMELGELPPGLSVNNGLISGTPTRAGEYRVPVQLANASGAGLQVELTFTVIPGDAQPKIAGLAAVELDYAELFEQQVEAINGPITAWRFAGLPPGLDYDATTGLITGRAARVGTFDAFLSAANVNGFGRAQLVKFVVKADPAAPVVTSSRSSFGSVASEMSYQIVASNLPATRPLPSNYSFEASGLPNGLTLDRGTGLIRGRPIQSGTYFAKVWAENESGDGTRHEVKFEIIDINDLDFRLSGPSFVSTTVGSDLVVELRGNGPIASSAFVYLGADVYFNDFVGDIRQNYHFDADSMFATIPAENTGNVVRLEAAGTGARQFFFQAYDRTNFIATMVHILPGSDNAVVMTPGEHYVVAGEEISIPLIASQPQSGGFSNPSVITPLPVGLRKAAFSPYIVGRLELPGTYSFQMAAFNDFGQGQPKDIRIFVAPVEAAPVINSVNAGQGASAETEPLAMAAFAASSDEKSFTLQTKETSGLVVNGTAGTFLEFTVDAGAGILEYRADDLPVGLVINVASGTISGVPERPGESVALVSARNEAGWGAPAEVTFSIEAAVGTPVIDSADVRLAQVGVLFSHALSATPTAASYNIEGLDTGLLIDPEAGTFEGSFDQAGVYTWTISGNNEFGEGYPQKLTVTVSAASGTPEVADPGLLAGRVGEYFEHALGATGTPTVWSVDGLPFGLSLDADTGVISGTPLESGASTHRFRAENASGEGPTTEIAFQIDPSLNAPVMTNAATFSVRAGDSLSFQLTASNDPVAFASGPLPSGLTLDATTGLLTGVPETEASHTLAFRVGNAHGEGPEQSFTLVVLPPLQDFDNWAAALPEGSRGFADEPFGLGIPNGVLFALDLSLDAPQRERLPVLEMTAQEGENYLSLIFIRSTEVGGIDYSLLGGETIGGIGPVPFTEEILDSPGPGLEQIRMWQDAPVTGFDTWFLRLGVVDTSE